MNINENDVAKLVQQVLQEMTSGAPASAPKAQAAPSGDNSKTAKVAMMTELKHFGKFRNTQSLSWVMTIFL